MPKRHGNLKFRAKMTEEALALASVFCATNKDLGQYWGVSEATVGRWIKKYPELCKRIEQAKLMVKQSLQTSMYKFAKGIEHYEKQANGEMKFTGWDKEPNMTAMIFLLTNKFKEDWKDQRSSSLINAIINKSEGSNGKLNPIETAFKEDIESRLREMFDTK